MKGQPYLCLAGTEVVNGARTVAYLNALSPGNLTTSTDDCGCDALGTLFLHPAADPAPWFEPSRPESTDFLGIVAFPRFESVHQRQLAGRASVGGSLGRLKLRPRTVVYTGVMYALTEEGMEYGERWLTDALAGSYDCVGCGTDEAEVMPKCGELQTGDGFRFLAEAGIIDGPNFAPEGKVAECRAQNVQFTLGAGVPYLLYPSDGCLAAQPLAAAGSSACCFLTTGTWVGDLGAQVILTAPAALDATDITVTLTPSTNGLGLCPEVDAVPAIEYRIPLLAAGTRLVIDGARRRVSLTDPTEQTTRGGLHLLEFDGAFDHLELAPCSEACLCVTNDGLEPITVEVQTFRREL